MKKVWKYPDEITDFVREHGHEGSVREMQERVNSRFGTSFTYDQMKSMFSRHKVHKLRCKFEFHPVSRDSLRMGSSLVLPNARFPQQTGFRIRSRP